MSLTAVCKLCGNRGPFGEVWGEGDSETRHRIVRCPSCAFVFLENPPPRLELKRFYQREWKEGSQEESYRRKAMGSAARIIEQLEAYGKQGRLLDVGAGPCFYLKAAQERGWETYGVDLVPLSFNKKEEGHFFEGVLEEAHFPGNFFDACLVVHTLSHLLDPVGTLKEIHRVMKRKGILFVGIPHFLRRGAMKLPEEKYFSLIHDQHLYYFSPRTAKRMVEESGFRILCLDTSHPIITGEQVEKSHIPFAASLGKISRRYGSTLKKFLRFWSGKLWIGPTISIWAEKP